MIMTTKEILQKSISSANKVEDAFYLFREDIFIDNIKSVQKAFHKRGIDLCLSYSMKTNNSQDVIEAVRACGIHIEVVSDRELEAAKNAGFSMNEVIYNGVISDCINKFTVAQHGGIVNVENMAELEALCSYSMRVKTKICIGLRINIEIRGVRNSRFGFVDENELNQAMEMLKNNPYIEVKCFHLHTHGYRNLDGFRYKCRRVLSLAGTYGISCIDLGSDLYGPMDKRLAQQFQESIPSFDDYANIFAEELQRIGKSTSSVRLILELGTPIVANTFSLVCSVQNIREIGSRIVATVNASIYDMGFLPLTKKVPIDIVCTTSSLRSSLKNVDIAGNSCVQGDFLYRDYNGEIEVGDLIIFSNIGAYSISLKPDFITDRLKIVKIK